MTTNTILLILFSLLMAGVLSFFQYFYKAKNYSKLNLFLAFLRFSSLFSILLLLINPTITKNSLEIVKSPLAIVVDNSSSIVDLKANEIELELYKKLSQNKELQDKFDIQAYQFDGEFRQLANFNFKGSQTNLDAISKGLKKSNNNKIFPTLIITDGNQTTGNDYVYSFDASNKVFPVVLGDTTKVLDIKISQLNVNKYAFLKNKFPVEVFLQYSGLKSFTADFNISQGNSILVKKKISFSPSQKTAIVNVLLTADKVGSQVFTANILSKEKEQNRYNNTKKFAVEIIDQKTNVAIISEINHPDLGALKRSIESNKLYKVQIVKPNNVKTLQDYNVLILYQPSAAFKTVFENTKIDAINTFVITGNNTDFNFLNQQQKDLLFKMSGQTEDYLATFNSKFNLFSIDNIGFETFPPLQNSYGNISVKGNVSVLLSSRIRNMETHSPLLAFAENQGKRSAYLLGENIWKWRMQSHIENGDFDKFDIFINKTIQFLASDSSKKALVVNHESFYNLGEPVEITAQYFNKNYEFDEKARLTISIVNTKTKESKNYDLLKSNNSYKVNLDGLMAGNYTFRVKELNSNTSYSSHFEILDFDVEKQFVNPDVDQLNQLANLTGGKCYFPNQVEQLIQTLLNDETYKAVQKNNVIHVSLIDWYWLLLLIALFLSSEWFIRKYNGLL